ncbi:MAG: AAA domain-containing protein [Anaerolineae bacterium]|mgnify:CR=1 FL=1|jgi:ATP-dependent Clp protease ATP-binding subunit ClpA|nr:AAA domain-containing protein [Anaerolineae bacterium]MBT7992185.1 AAA domain-containing protein [Anaerolineae bacterium]
MTVLYTYSQSLFKELKEHVLAEGNQIFTIPYVESFGVDEGEIIFIDITSLIMALLQPNSSTYAAETLLYRFDTEDIDYRLITDEKFAEDALKLLRHNISEIEEVESFTQSEELDSPHEKRKKRKLIIDLSKDETEQCMRYVEENLIGHQVFKSRLREKIKHFRTFNKMGDQKILSIFILGKSGVGKTEVGRLLHKFLDPESKLIKINFGNYSSKDALNTLIGSPKGYIGSETGELNEKINRSNSGIILIDEFEKADEKIFNFFLELLEDGKFTSTQNIEYDLNGFIIIFTSNLKENDFEKVIFPELKSRFDYICAFSTLTYEEKENYVKDKLNEMIQNYNGVFNKEILKINNISEVDIDVDEFENMRDLNTEIRKSLIRKAEL